MRFILLSVCFILIYGCSKPKQGELAAKNSSLIQYVNPFIGTGGHGHTFPGASMPFGMMQLSPDTRLTGWDGCSGYHYSDEYIYGFSHTHLSGTGVSDYGDVLLMPTNTINFNNGADAKKGYRAHFSHKNEIAKPGYYSVKLDSTNISVELTVSYRSGMHKYQFPSAENQIVILDLLHRDQLLDAKIEPISNHKIVGYRFSEAWAADQRIFFAMETSHPFNYVFETNATNARQAALQFINPNNEPVTIKIGISAVDIDGAIRNLTTELKDKTFEDIKKLAEEEWEAKLQKIIIETAYEEHKINFYTALYHTMIAPNLYQDVDGRYRDMDMEIHQSNEHTHYTVFSLWDTFRATHPLYTIIEQERTNDFMKTFIKKYETGGILPIWDLSANYTGCMIGYHAVPVIADAYMKGIRGYDVDKAFEAMLHSATRDKLGLDSYKTLGFVPVEKESESVSKTLEYAYDDWTIAQMAKELGKSEVYKTYIKRAQNYKNVFDPETYFMRGRFKNTCFSPFDPYEVNFNYTEANAWQYSFYVPQDITGLINLHGGKDQLENKLDELFAANQKTSGRQQADITGLIGQYAHGNEPSHHMAYLYNFINKSSKTQHYVDEILTTLYSNQPDGISGNEDCGQMSAWYVFSSLGFYPVTPGNNEYIIGRPLFDKATIHLENGKIFTIEAKNNSKENKYILSAKLNGKDYSKSYFNHQDIINGGNLVFEMTNNPTNWATEEADVPKTQINDYSIIPAPFIAKGEIAFKGETEVILKTVDEEATIFYSLDKDTIKYQGSFKILEDSKLTVFATRDNERSPIITTNFYKIDPNLKIELATEYANQYNAGGNNALIDGVLGTEDFRTGTWQGYFDENVDATIDLGSLKTIKSISTQFLQDQKSWIFLPTEIKILTSVDGKNYKLAYNYELKKIKPAENASIEKLNININEKNIRYIKLIAKKLGQLPEWHLGYTEGGRSWLFIDEIKLNY